MQRALAAAVAIASALGLPADDVIVLHDSNKLTARLLPCDIVARVAPRAHQAAQFCDTSGGPTSRLRERA